MQTRTMSPEALAALDVAQVQADLNHQAWHARTLLELLRDNDRAQVAAVVARQDRATMAAALRLVGLD